MRLINRDLGRAMRGLEVDMGVSKCTIRRSSCTSATVTVGSPWSSLQLWWWLGSSPTRRDMIPTTSSRGVSYPTPAATSTSWGMWSSLRWIRWLGGTKTSFSSMGPLPTMPSWPRPGSPGTSPTFWGKELWPPSSHDCNPHDYYVSGACEQTINRSPQNTLDSLKTTILAGFSAMPCAEIMHAFSR